MKEDLLRLKTDILNDLRNERYYVLDELQKLVDSNVSQRVKVTESKDLIFQITMIDHQISTTEAIFVTSEPEQPVSDPEQLQPEVKQEPNNVVESQLVSPSGPVTEILNEKGQSHSE